MQTIHFVNHELSHLLHPDRIHLGRLDQLTLKVLVVFLCVFSNKLTSFLVIFDNFLSNQFLVKMSSKALNFFLGTGIFILGYQLQSSNILMVLGDIRDEVVRKRDSISVLANDIQLPEFPITRFKIFQWSDETSLSSVTMPTYLSTIWG